MDQPIEVYHYDQVIDFANAIVDAEIKEVNPLGFEIGSSQIIIVSPIRTVFFLMVHYHSAKGAYYRLCHDTDSQITEYVFK